MMTWEERIWNFFLAGEGFPAVAFGSCDGSRLFMNFFDHEMRITIFLGCGNIPVYFHIFRFYGMTV